MTAGGTKRRGWFGKIPRDERGAALIIAIIVLGSLSLMALAALLSSQTEMKIARNQRLHARAFWAAEGGIHWALSQMNLHWDHTDAQYVGAPIEAGTNKYDATVGDNGPWTGSLPDGSSYSVTVGWKRDLDDQDEDNDAGDTITTADVKYNTPYSGGSEIVFYNPWYGYADSPAESVQNGGYPVQVITADGRSGSSRVRITFEVGKTPFDIDVKGALTVTSDVSLIGTVTVDGRDHDLSGNLTSGCSTDSDTLPAISTTGGQTVVNAGAASLETGDASDPDGWNADDSAATFPRSPEEALGLSFDAPAMIRAGATAAQILAASPLSRYVVYSPPVGDPQVTPEMPIYLVTDYPSNGPTSESNRGILIVHNPLFDPEVWRVSDPASLHYDPASTLYDGRLDNNNPGTYDAAYKTAHKPARLGNWNTGTFRGLVIADEVNALTGNTHVIGAIISLSSVAVTGVGTGTARVDYSCEALAKMATTGYSLKLSWSRE